MSLTCMFSSMVRNISVPDIITYGFGEFQKWMHFLFIFPRTKYLRNSAATSSSLGLCTAKPLWVICSERLHIEGRFADCHLGQIDFYHVNTGRRMIYLIFFFYLLLVSRNHNQRSRFMILNLTWTITSVLVFYLTSFYLFWFSVNLYINIPSSVFFLLWPIKLGSYGNSWNWVGERKLSRNIDLSKSIRSNSKCQIKSIH